MQNEGNNKDENRNKLDRKKQQRKSRKPKTGSWGKKLKKQMNIQQNWKNMTQISKMRNERCTITQTLQISKVYTKGNELIFSKTKKHNHNSLKMKWKTRIALCVDMS